MEKTQYFYKLPNGKLKKYVGNVIERDGKIYGTLIKPETTYEVKDLINVDSHEAIESETTYLVWKDKFGIEHELTPDLILKDNKVIDKREYKINIDYHPSKAEKAEFKTKNGNIFEGEIIEQDGKFFGKL